MGYMNTPTDVIAGLDPAIHDEASTIFVDRRVKPGDDTEGEFPTTVEREEER